MTSEGELERKLDDGRRSNTDIEKAFRHSTALGANRLTLAASGEQAALGGFGRLRTSGSITYA